ncbi:MAG: 16S rRNA (cytosine(967)-C(5))-methyltransferase RsmB [Clostridia bacterium]|nr:16S rRNA (cytosine(967)-C(5))-methyltransferase RsmB [Clostridia bacterium]MBR7173589.1 16S rRNA (cytosine(967)-C(5))-methyltransferase RsmB [Clostridia bacterium]
MSEKAKTRGEAPKTAGGRTNGKTGRRTFGRAAGQSDGKPGGKSFGKPAGKAGGKNFGKPAGKTGGKSFGKPAGKADGRSFGKPEKAKRFSGTSGTAERPAAEERKYTGKPGPAGRPAGGRPFGRRPAAPGSAVRKTPAVPARKARPEEMEGLASRRAALKVIRAVTEEGAYASLVLDRTLTGSGLSGADRRLAARLAYDTLDRMIYLDHMLGQVMAREDTDIRLRNILRLGACQILIEDRIPESAATNTCVQLCTEIGLEALKGVCNGILRNLIRRKEELKLPDPAESPEESFAIRNSLPVWLAKRLRADWGEEEAEKIATWRNPEGGITIRRNLIRTDEAGFQAMLDKKVWEKEAGTIPGTRKIRGAMDIAKDADFLAGNFSIQSESSMMACLAVGAKRGSQILDCCAAPGGKSCYLSEMMGDTGRVQAWDIHEHRVALIAAQQKRLGLENIRPITRDASKYREDLETRMDAVLLDAPCSGLGVIAEKPDIKGRVTEESVEELIRIQQKILETVCRYVRPGGVLVYSTCSVLKDENENQIRAFLERHPEFEAEKLPAAIPEQYRRHEGLGLQLMPHRDGVEGFYICRMRRKDTDA